MNTDAYFLRDEENFAPYRNQTLPPDDDDFTLGDAVVPKYVPIPSTDLQHAITSREARIVSRLSTDRAEQALSFKDTRGVYLRGFFKKAPPEATRSA